MTEMEKMKAGLEYCFTDKELIARKSLAIVRCEEYNAIDGMDRQAQYEYLKQMLHLPEPLAYGLGIACLVVAAVWFTIWYNKQER